MRKFLLLIALIISGLGLNAQSVGDYTIIECDGYSLKFTVTKVSPAECSVTCSTKPTSSMAVTIPASVEIGGTNFNVTSIGDEAFYQCYNYLTSIEIPSGVTSIGSSAFEKCSSLTSIEIPSGVTSIGSSAFSYCSSLETVTFGENSQLTSIENYAFHQCSSLSSIEIPSNVTSIGNYAFYQCSSLSSIEIPSGVTSIGQSTFKSCSNLETVTFGENSQLTSIGETAFWDCSSLTSIEIPSGVTSIGSFAFYQCSSLSSIKCHAAKVPETSSNAFNSCPSDMTIYVPASFVDAYKVESPWKNYNIVSLPEMGDYTIINHDGYSLKFTITDVSLSECEVVCETKPTTETAIAIPSTATIEGLECSVTSIKKYAFYQCSSLSSIEIPSNVTSIGNYAFYQCSSLSSIEIPSGVTSIGNYAFYQCSSLSSIEIPSGVTSIGNYAFWDCSSLTSIEIPSGVTSIGQSTFKSCSNLETVTFGENSQLTSIGDDAFYNCHALTSIEIPSGVTSIGYYAFKSCSNLETVTFGENSQLTSIGPDAFYSCSNLTSIEIPSNVTSIGNYAFYKCSSLSSIEIPSGVTSIGSNSFKNCSNLTSIEIPSNVTSIGNYAFYDCSSLNNVYIYRITPATLGSIVFPSNVSTIYVPSTALSSYKDATNWSSYSSKIIGMPTYTSNGWIAADGNSPYTPSATDNVVLNEHLTLSSGTRTNNILTVNTLGITENGSLTIEDGAQLIANKVVGNVTVEKKISGHNVQQSTDNGQQTTKWYTISSPLKGNVDATDITNLISEQPANYALYRYDEPRFTWENYKYLDNNFTTLNAGRGYLYANANGATLSFEGDINTEPVEYKLTANGTTLSGIHLIGNPFTHDIAYSNFILNNATLAAGYYVLSNQGAWDTQTYLDNEGKIKPNQGALIKASVTGSDATLTINNIVSSKGQQPTANSQQPMLALNVSNGNYSDRAFVIFGKGIGLDKINHQNEEIPVLYIPMSDADYAIAMMDENVNEIPVGFESSSMGEFTISLRQENCEFEELYLLDKETGAKVNILEEDYTFMATSGDNADRFILVKSQGSQPEAQSNFAYINNGDVVIYGAEGNAHIDIYDVLGRRVYNTTGRDDVHIVSTDGYSAGVYVIRLMDEKGLRTQKVIID